MTAATIGIVAWPPQVTMLTFGRVEVLVEVDRGDDVRADGGGGEVDQPLAERRQLRGVGLVRLGRGGVEDDLDLVEVGQRHQAVDALGGGRHAEPRGAGEAVGVGVDADHRAHLEVLGWCASP